MKTNRILALLLTISLMAVCAVMLIATNMRTAQAAPVHQTRDLPNWVTTPCAKEGDVNCRWIATGPRAQGNGKGHTYIVRQVPGPKHMVCVFYAQPRYARHHDYCS